MIAIINYGVGNLGSVKNALDYLKLESKITSDKEEILDADKIILPGVGAFEDAMKAFKSLELDKVLLECINAGKPVLGICVGMQMLFEYSYEYGKHEGLGIFKGNIIKFDDTNYKVPHMGWNNISITKNNKLLEGLDNQFVYFVHSYHLDESNFEIATCEYAGVKYPCAVNRDNIYAVQFHPEKSGDIGLQILKNFGDL
ncbi:MAG: imidazole glycerol phosphate synthase subunit HisH [Erysipelotrichaceae bacterium]|nr:imidazole glycerol phosphate synthase subunit HisH [Erysipelotrichaceae bacterium]